MEKQHPLVGRKQSPEHVQKRKEAVARNRATWSEEKIANRKRRISENSKAGTPEVRKKNSDAHKGKVAWNKGRECPEWSGENHWNFGKPMPDYVKEAISKATVGRKHTDEEKAKVSAKLKGIPRSEEVKQKIRETSIAVWNTPEMKARSTGSNGATWKGLLERGLVPYDTYAAKLEGIDECRRWAEDERVLQVKCAYCGQWFSPDPHSVYNRVKSIYGQSSVGSEARLYCSQACKRNCPSYRKISIPRGYGEGTSREVQADLRKMVFERDAWKCQICETNGNLHCHHITGVVQNPIESADVDNCITLCMPHHKWVHTQQGCGYFELRCK
jgi:hypothetical protein